MPACAPRSRPHGIPGFRQPAPDASSQRQRPATATAAHRFLNLPLAEAPPGLPPKYLPIEYLVPYPTTYYGVLLIAHPKLTSLLRNCPRGWLRARHACPALAPSPKDSICPQAGQRHRAPSPKKKARAAQSKLSDSRHKPCALRTQPRGRALHITVHHLQAPAGTPPAGWALNMTRSSAAGTPRTIPSAHVPCEPAAPPRVGAAQAACTSSAREKFLSAGPQYWGSGAPDYPPRPCARSVERRRKRAGRRRCSVGRRRRALFSTNRAAAREVLARS